MSKPPSLPIVRFIEKFAVADDGCWLWLGVTGGSKSTYGYFYAGGPPVGSGKKVVAHRWSYEHFVGPIPEGLELDHLCRHPLRVNPDHLEPVTTEENSRRARLRTCRSGRHDLAGVPSQRFDERGRRRGCQPCRDELEARRVVRRREARARAKVGAQ